MLTDAPAASAHPPSQGPPLGAAPQWGVGRCGCRCCPHGARVLWGAPDQPPVSMVLLASVVVVDGGDDGGVVRK
eukprot:1158562-Pelagomonas_calceolata.AAC.2